VKYGVLQPTLNIKRPKVMFKNNHVQLVKEYK